MRSLAIAEKDRPRSSCAASSRCTLCLVGCASCATAARGPARSRSLVSAPAGSSRAHFTGRLTVGLLISSTSPSHSWCCAQCCSVEACS